MKIMLLTPKESSIIEVRALMAVGGKASSGHKTTGLSKTDDYAVISPSASGLTIVPLRGKQRTPKEIQVLSRFEIDDLTIIPLPLMESEKAKVPGPAADITGALTEITGASDDKAITSIVLRHLVSLGGFDRGLVIARNPKGQFEVIAHQGTDPSAPWLSESLLGEILSSKRTIIVPSVIGSRFERNQSLVGTGFLSVAAWPLIWRGEAVGAIIAGSALPHAEDQGGNPTASILSSFAAQFVHSWVKEKRLEEQLKSSRLVDGDGPFLTQSRDLKEMSGLARKVAPSDLSVLIQGETGVGKEVLAKWIHENGLQGKGPFVAVNCGAIPENLIESVLFGHRKGAFTGAIADQAGKFVLAHGGTIFLDEVADLPLAIQGKLLRVLQEKVVDPLGAARPISIQIRVLSATHKDLKKLVEKGQFREDLYYRLAEMTLEIPPLRERSGDIILICQQYLKENRIEKKLSSSAWEWVQAQKWPGNVRELLSHLKRANLLSQGHELEIKDFIGTATGQKERTWLGGRTLDEAIKNFQAEKVKMALQLSQGNRKNAADLLGINQRTLFRYLEEGRQ